MGSYIHAKSLHDTKTEVLGMICYEMIGYFSDKPHSQPYPDPLLELMYPSTANFIVCVGIEKHAAFQNQFYKNMKAGAQIDVQTIAFPEAASLAAMSDHTNYWKFGLMHL